MRLPGGRTRQCLPKKDRGQRGGPKVGLGVSADVADGGATAGDCLRGGRVLYGRSPGLIPTQHPPTSSCPGPTLHKEDTQFGHIFGGSAFFGAEPFLGMSPFWSPDPHKKNTQFREILAIPSL